MFFHVRRALKRFEVLQFQVCFAMCLVETKLEGLLLQVHKSPEIKFISQINVEVFEKPGDR